MVGICGGYQMLGRSAADPDGVESCGIAEGFGLLNVTTRLLTNKVTRLVEGGPASFRCRNFLLGAQVLHSHG